jgi:hypothetical protein
MVSPSPSAPESVAVPPPFPAVSRPARVYLGSENLYPSSVYQSSLASRFVLYDDGTFALQFASVKNPFFEYRGTYIEATLPTPPEVFITFTWEGWSSAGPWGATGTLNDRSLTVAYNLIMVMTDFVDGVYVRTQ